MREQGVTLVTGANGFLGRRVAAALLRGGQGSLLLTDKSEPTTLYSGRTEVRFVQCDLTEAGACDALISRGVSRVFHLASLVSGGAEADFEAGLRVNVMATLSLLEACRKHAGRPCFVFPSSIATFGGRALPPVVDDRTFQHPRSSYGVAKVIGEQLLSDYSRKGYVDGRGLRLAAIVVRDEPNSAASGYVSEMIREPLRGKDYACPVGEDTRIPVASARCAVEGLLRLAEVNEQALYEHRTINAPSLSPSAADLRRAVEKCAPAGRACGTIRFRPVAAVQRIIEGWPSEMKAEEAARLGLPSDPSIEQIIEYYLWNEAGDPSK